MLSVVEDSWPQSNGGNLLRRASANSPLYLRWKPTSIQSPHVATARQAGAAIPFPLSSQLDGVAETPAATECLAVSSPSSRGMSRWEVGVDGAIHAAAIAAALVGAAALLWISSTRGASTDIAAVAIYSIGLVAMLVCSGAYNLARGTRHGQWLRSLDHAAIFVMIAGTYTPFTVLHMQGAWSLSFTGTVWSVAAAGILVRLLRGRLFDRISIWLYLALGWMGIVALAPLVQTLDNTTLILLTAGGALYTTGVVFHLWERLPFQIAIWHGFVVTAAAIHYAAVLFSILAATSNT